MEKKKKLIIFALLLSVSAVLLFFYSGSAPLKFVRLKFSIDKGKTQADQNLSSSGFVDIKYSAGEELFLRPGVKGERGLILDLSATSDKWPDGRITIDVMREGAPILRKVLLFKKRNLNFTLSERMAFQKNDLLRIGTKGSGRLIVKDPVLYRINDPKKKNYIFVIGLDNLRFDKIGKKVNGVEITPNLNRLMEDSVTFTNGYSQSSWTLPAFTSLFTGLNEFNHGITRDTYLKKNIDLLTDNFAKKFVTVSINGGVWLGPKTTGYRGFDVFKLGSRTKDVNASEKFFNNAIDFLRNNDIPDLFMFMHTFAIHAPYFPPEKFLLKLKKNPAYKFLKAFTHDRQYKSDVPEKIREYSSLLYEADIFAFDHFFGKFLNYLKQEGIYERSLIVFLSDHGEEFYEHKGWFHGHSHYDEMIKIPLIIKFPGNKYSGKKIGDLVGLIDVLPTLSEYLGIKTDQKIDGVSLLPLVEGGIIEERTLVSSTTICRINDRSPQAIALLRGRFKYIHNIDNVNRKGKKLVWEAVLKRGDNELYDLNSDPGELHNLIIEKPVITEKFKRDMILILKKVKENFNSGKVKRGKLSESEKEKLKTLGYL
ncbi:MAG: sulfatase-like hydrolase/transferase [Acidobacteriota bacterium]